jgi:integrase
VVAGLPASNFVRNNACLMGLLNLRQRCYLPRFAVGVLAKMREVLAEIQCRECIVAEFGIVSERVPQPGVAQSARCLLNGEQDLALPGIRFHDLRHTHATTLLARGHSIKAVSHRLGHGSIDITLKTYAHVLPEDDKTLATGLDRMFG